MRRCTVTNLSTYACSLHVRNKNLYTSKYTVNILATQITSYEKCLHSLNTYITDPADTTTYLRVD
jgi:hypothetical protein